MLSISRGKGHPVGELAGPCVIDNVVRKNVSEQYCPFPKDQKLAVLVHKAVDSLRYILVEDHSGR